MKKVAPIAKYYIFLEIPLTIYSIPHLPRKGYISYTSVTKFPVICNKYAIQQSSQDTIMIIQIVKYSEYGPASFGT